MLHEGDTDTLVHFSADNTIQLKTGGSSRFVATNLGVSLENGYLNSNGNRIILGDSSGANDDRLVLGNTNDLQLYHNASDSYIENATGVLKILGDDIQLGEGNDTVGIGTDNAGAKLDVLGNFQVKDASGLQNFYISDSGFKFNQTVSNWSNMTYTSSPVLGWDYKNGPGDLMYMASGGNTPTASQMALVVSDGHGVKIGKSGYDGTDYDISSSDEYLRITTTGQIGIGTASVRNSRAMQLTGASNSLFLITGHAPSVCLNADPDDSSDNDRTFLGQAAGSNNFANGTAAGDTILRGTSSERIVFAAGTNVRMYMDSGGDFTMNAGSLYIPDTIGHLGDTDTKIRFPTTDNISFETGGSERFLIKADGTSQFTGKITNSPSYTSHNTNFYGGDVNTGGVRIEVAHSTTTVSGNTASAAFPHHLLLSNYSGNGSADNRMCSIGFDIPTTSTHANAVIAYQATAAGTGDLQFHLESGNSISERMRINSNGDVLPGADNDQDLGSSSKRWANIYSADLQLSNEGSTNDVDGTWGQYTIQEGETDLFLINKRNGKKYKFMLEEVN